MPESALAKINQVNIPIDPNRQGSIGYAPVQGGFNGKSYIKVMDWIAHKTAQTLAETKRL
jgi:hypothetical protein